jgi:TonB-linked SusC/RagA family outer membrane protein
MASGQEQGVGGVVVESTSRRPLVGVQVVVEGTDRGTITDNRGRFVIPDLAGAQVTLRVVIIGYRELTETVTVGRMDLVLALMESAVTLDQIIVTGTPQQQLKRALGNSVGTVDVTKLTEVAPPPNVQKLFGTVAGVAILSGGGDIGSGANVRIRGANSLSLSSEPLLYIDGVRASSTVNNGPGMESRSPPSRMNDIDPDNIESIEIIKGPAAATLYGTEASNGVINIITKRGSAGSPVWSFSVKHGANWLPDPETLFPPAYYRNAAGQIVEFSPLRSDRITGEYPGDTIAYGPWFRTGQPREYEGSVSGGTGPLTYFFATGWGRDEGPVVYNWRNRLSSRANLTYTPGDRLSVDVGLSFVKSRYRSAGAGQPVSVSIQWACPSPGCEPGRGLPGGVDGPTRGYLTGPPERHEDDFEGLEDLGRGTLTSTVRHRPFSWLSHRLTIGGDFTAQRLSSLSRLSTTAGASQIGTRSVENYREDLASVDYSAVVTSAIGSSLDFESAAGLQYYQKQTSEVTATGSTFPIRALETVSAGALRSGAETFLEAKTVGAYVQQQVSWRNRIFVTGAVRGDDNSAFGRNYDFVVYPKLSGSWVVSDEPFMASFPVFNSLKLRGAWGRAGQQPEAFAALRIYAPSSGQNGAPTLTPSNIGNPDLQPEVGEEIEAGVDATLLDERLGLEFTYYTKKTKDAIVQVPVTPSLGFPGSQFRNIGEVANRGFEFGILGEAIRLPDVQLGLGVKFSRNDNEVVSLGGPASIVISAPFGQYNVTGFPLGSIFMTRVVSADLDRSGTVPRAINMMCEGGERIAGTNFSAGGGAPVPCANAPAVFWGASQPTWEGSANLSLTLFRNLQLYAQADFMGGHTLLSGDIRASLMSFRNQIAIIEANDPILMAYDILDIRRQPGTIDAGFAKLRDISATYSLPRGLTESFGISRASITVSGQNLWTIWRAQMSDFGVRHVDVEIRSNTNELTAYYQEGWPQIKRVLTTLRVTF